MATARARSHKHFQLDAAKLRRAQRVLSAKTETETIERALDVVIAEHERNRLTVEANDRFIRSGIDINDAYGTLEK
jgi:hypothetical protein